MSPPGSLERFRRAQDRTQAGFVDALGELRASKKRSHWIWYVFPQLHGLGSSPAAAEYGLRGAEEAREYLADPTLRERLLAVTRVVAEQLDHGVQVRDLMGSEIDALKLVSSLTLFEGVIRHLDSGEASPAAAELGELASAVLAEAERQGIPRCAFTRQRLWPV